MANSNAKARALKGNAKFTFKDHEYEVQAEALDDIEVFELFEDEKYMTAVKKVLGKEEFETFKDNNRNEQGRVSMEVFTEFVETMFEALNLGN